MWQRVYIHPLHIINNILQYSTSIDILCGLRTLQPLTPKSFLFLETTIRQLKTTHIITIFNVNTDDLFQCFDNARAPTLKMVFGRCGSLNERHNSLQLAGNFPNAVPVVILNLRQVHKPNSIRMLNNFNYYFSKKTLA